MTSQMEQLRQHRGAHASQRWRCHMPLATRSMSTYELAAGLELFDLLDVFLSLLFLSEIVRMRNERVHHTSCKATAALDPLPSYFTHDVAYLLSP